MSRLFEAIDKLDSYILTESRPDKEAYLNRRKSQLRRGLKLPEGGLKTKESIIDYLNKCKNETELVIVIEAIADKEAFRYLNSKAFELKKQVKDSMFKAGDLIDNDKVFEPFRQALIDEVKAYEFKSDLKEEQNPVAEKSFGRWRLTVQPSEYHNDKMTVTFFDLNADPKKFPGGQQTPATYYVDTLLSDEDGPSITKMPYLRLHMEVPEWTVQHDDLVDIAEWLKQFNSNKDMKESEFEHPWAKEVSADLIDKIRTNYAGQTISKRRDKAEQKGGLMYVANELGVEDLFDVLKALEVMCSKGLADEIDDSTYKVKESMNESNPFAPTDDDWDDINHWYNDDPREEWDKQSRNNKSELSTAESKLLDIISICKHFDNLDGVKLRTTPEGNVWVTYNGEDLVTIGRRQFTEEDLDDLRTKGYFNEEDLNESKDSTAKYRCIRGMSHPNMGTMFEKGKIYNLTKDNGSTVTLDNWNIDKKYLDKNFKRIDESEDTKEYRYITNHGVGPGMCPENTFIRSEDLDNGKTAIYLSRVLSDEELKKYDIKPEWIQ